MNPAAPEKVSLARRALFFIKFLEIRLRFVAILVLTALMVGYWDHIQNYYERWQRTHHAESGAAAHPDGQQAPESEYEYYCGMHPFVVRDHPDKCPLCGMDLVKRKKGAPMTLPEGTLSRVQVSPERIMQAGVQVEPVSYRLLLRTIRSYGAVELDETRQAKIVARFPGRIEELMVNAVGMVVKKGEPLARIYTPKFLAASQEYTRALINQRRVDSDARVNDDEKRRAAQLVEASRERLALAGFTATQLDAIAKGEGATNSVTLHSPVNGTVMEKSVVLGETVEEGTVLYNIADLSTLWVQALIAESDIAGVKLNMPVEVTTVSQPGVIFYGVVDFIYPALDPESRSVKVRVVVTNPEGKLKPGMYVNTVIHSPVGQSLDAESGRVATAVSNRDLAPAKSAAKPAVQLPTKTQDDANQFLAALAEGAQFYTCSMHPEVVSDKPGDCPLCNMKLIAEKKKLSSPLPASGPLPALPTKTPEDAARFLASLANGASYYVCSMHSEVVSDKPGDCPLCNMKLTPETKKGQSDALPPLDSAGSTDHWAEGYACPMHLNELTDKPGVCVTCGCGMALKKYRIERVLSIPESAVIDTGTQKVVYEESAPGVFDAHAVTLGARVGAYYPVLDGLKLGQRIATRGSFLIDAEARLNPASSGVTAASGEHKHGG